MIKLTWKYVYDWSSMDPEVFWKVPIGLQDEANKLFWCIAKEAGVTEISWSELRKNEEALAKVQRLIKKFMDLGCDL